MLIDQDAAALAELQAGGLGQVGFGTDADRGDHHRRGQGPAVAEGDGVGADRGDRGAGDHGHAVRDQVLFDQRGHLHIQRGQDLIGQLHDGDRQAALGEVLGQFDADEPPAHDHRGRPRLIGTLFGAGRTMVTGRGLQDRVDRGGHLVGIGDIAQRQRPLHPGDRRHERRRAGGQDQLVIALGVFGAGGQVLHRHRLGGTIDGHRLAVDAHVDAETGFQAARGLQQQRIAVGDQSADVVRQPAVGEGHVAGPFQHHDLGLLIKPPQPRRSRHATCDPTNNHRLHARNNTPGGIGVRKSATLTRCGQRRILPARAYISSTS